MRIKADDLRLLMDYLDKELVDDVDIIVNELGFNTQIDFKDTEGRECTVILYDSVREMKPDLVKKMQLITRLKRIKPLEDK